MFAPITANFGGTAEPIGDMTGFSPGDFYGNIINVLIVLAVVVGLIVLLIRFLAAKTSRWSAGRQLRIHAGVQLGQNKSLQVVEIGDTIYIVGVGENITLIDRIDDPEKARALAEALTSQAASATAGFGGAAALLRRLRERGTSRAPEAEDELSAEAFRDLLASKLNAAGSRREEMKSWKKEEER